MRITTKAEYRWGGFGVSGGRYFLARWEGYELPAHSRVALCKGPSASEQDVANGQQSFANTLQGDYGTTFANQQSMLNNLTNSLTNTVKGGPGQYGYSAQEDTGLRTQADSGTAAAYKNAKEATGEAAAAAGGGNAVLPTGASSQTNEQLAQSAAQQQSNQQLGITNAGYQQGEQNYQNAVNGLDTVASLENPNGTASAANTGAANAFGSANTVSQQQNAANPWNIAGGILGGAASAAVGGLTGNPAGVLGGLSSMFGSSGPPSITAGGTGEGQLGNPFTSGNLGLPGSSNSPISMPSF